MQGLGGGGLGFLLMGGLILLGKKSAQSPLSKSAPFECGFKSSNNSAFFFSVQFFLVALVFLVFDMELVLMFPAALSGLNCLMAGAAGSLIFWGLLVGGFLWEWSQGGLEWIF